MDVIWDDFLDNNWNANYCPKQRQLLNWDATWDKTLDANWDNNWDANSDANDQSKIAPTFNLGR